MTRVLILAVCLAACAASPFTAPPSGLPTTLGDREVFYGPRCIVIARSESSAADLHDCVALLADQVKEATGKVPARGLVLAMEFDDPLLIEPVEAYATTMGELHARATGATNLRVPFETAKTKDGREVEIDPAVPMRMRSFAVPRDDETLSLPQILRDQAAFVAVLPTTDCLEEVADVVFEAGMEAEGISMWKRAMLAPFHGTLIDQLVQEFRKTSRATVIAACLPVGSVDEATIDRVCELAGVSPRLVHGRPSTGPSKEEVDAVDDAITHLRTVPHDRRLTSGPTGEGLVATAYAQLAFTHFIEVAPTPSETMRAAAQEHQKHYSHVPVAKGLPDRTAAEELDAAIPRDVNSRVLVVSAEPEQRALLLGAHAYYFCGVDVPTAVQTAVELGAVNQAPAFAKALANSPRSDPEPQSKR
ncbi:MAG: hypothetical protein ABL997_07825 [Planctomycetota bacterium]